MLPIMHKLKQIQLFPRSNTSTMKGSKSNKYCDRRPVHELIHNSACITQLLHGAFSFIQSEQAQTRSVAFGEEKTVLLALRDTHFLHIFVI